MSSHPTVAILKEKFGEQHFDEREFRGDTTVIIPKSLLIDVLKFLRDDPRCGYNQLIDVWGADYMGYPNEEARFGLLYPLLNIEENRRITIKLLIALEDMQVPTATGLFAGAEWPEREAAEMFGFIFVGHPDPRRLLLCDLFDGKYPLRKDYPLKGMGERESYTPVTTESA